MNKWMRLSFLILGGGTIFKLSSIKDVFYVPMQESWGLTNAEIGYGFTVYTIVQMIGLFGSLYIADRFSKKILLPIGLIGVGVCGLYLSTLPTFTGYLITFAAMALFADVVYWPVLLKAVRLLGNKQEQGRLFGFLEAGRGVVDVIIASGALFFFVLFGEGKEGMQAGILFYAIVTITMGFITYFIVDNDDAIAETTSESSKQVIEGIKSVIKCKNLWLTSLTIFFIYTTYCGLTYFIPFLKDIYALPIALVGAYGIINQYALKMVGGPIGGILSDKVFKSPTRFLQVMSIIAAIAMGLFMLIPHESLDNVYLGMIATLGFAAIIFAQRAVFFAPMEEIGTKREYAGSAMAFACILGYLPAIFAYTLYGTFLDKYPGIQGYYFIFSIMLASSLLSYLTATLLLKRIKQRNKIGE